MMDYVQAKMIAMKTPKVLIKQKWYRRIKMKLFPGYFKMCKILYGEFEPYIFGHIKARQEEHISGQFDISDASDYLDYLLAAARQDPSAELENKID